MNREPTIPDEELLSAYLDGECTDGETAWVEAQLEGSAEVRAVLDEVREARAAVRSLPRRDAPPEFWARLLATDLGVEVHAAEVGAEPAIIAAGEDATVDLAEHRRRRHPRRWVAAVAGIAAAMVIGAVAFVPEEQPVTPPVAAFADAHALRSSLQSDAVSSLVPLAVQGGFPR